MFIITSATARTVYIITVLINAQQGALIRVHVVV